MDYASVFAIGASGMNFERARVHAAATNIANMNTVQQTDGTGYAALRVIGRSTTALPVGDQPFSRFVQGYADATGTPFSTVPAGPAYTLERVNTRARLQYEPGHPAANEKGFVAYPGIDLPSEMMTVMTALRSYEANVAAISSARTMALRALDIGGSN